MNEQKKVSELKLRDFLQYLFYALLGSIIITSSLLNVIMFVNLFVIVIVFIISQITHEAGHYLSYWISKRDVYLALNRVKLPEKIIALDTKERPFTSWELTRASIFGIIVGVIPINIYFLVTGNFMGYLILHVFYIYASRFDIIDVRNSLLSYLHNIYIDSSQDKEGL